MSLQTWKDEFYPVDAATPMTRMDALVHSQRKWIGLRQENLDRHKVVRAVHWNENARRVVDSHYLVDAANQTFPTSKNYFGMLDQLERHPYLPIAAATCALCAKYADGPEVNEGDEENEDGVIISRECEECPLVVGRDPTDACADEYGTWALREDPEPMIALITSAIEREGKDYT